MHKFKLLSNHTHIPRDYSKQRNLNFNWLKTRNQKDNDH